VPLSQALPGYLITSLLLFSFLLFSSLLLCGGKTKTKTKKTVQLDEKPVWWHYKPKPKPTPIQSSIHPLRWGWVFLGRTRILSGIQFTTHCIDFFVLETKRFLCSFVNVILARQTCGQRSSRAAESKH